MRSSAAIRVVARQTRSGRIGCARILRRVIGYTPRGDLATRGLPGASENRTLTCQIRPDACGNCAIVTQVGRGTSPSTAPPPGGPGRRPSRRARSLPGDRGSVAAVALGHRARCRRAGRGRRAASGHVGSCSQPRRREAAWRASWTARLRSRLSRRRPDPHRLPDGDTDGDPDAPTPTATPTATPTPSPTVVPTGPQPPCRRPRCSKAAVTASGRSLHGVDRLQPRSDKFRFSVRRSAQPGSRRSRCPNALRKVAEVSTH